MKNASDGRSEAFGKGRSEEINQAADDLARRRLIQVRLPTTPTKVQAEIHVLASGMFGNVGDATR